MKHNHLLQNNAQATLENCCRHHNHDHHCSHIDTTITSATTAGAIVVRVDTIAAEGRDGAGATGGAVGVIVQPAYGVLASVVQSGTLQPSKGVATAVHVGTVQPG